jgi:hypothetical protein
VQAASRLPRLPGRADDKTCLISGVMRTVSHRLAAWGNHAGLHAAWRDCGRFCAARGWPWIDVFSCKSLRIVFIKRNFPYLPAVCQYESIFLFVSHCLHPNLMPPIWGGFFVQRRFAVQ